MNQQTVRTKPLSLFVEAMQSTYLRLQGKTAAALLWNRHLTREQRRRLGGDPDRAYSQGKTVGIWMRLHGVTAQRAVIDLAKLLNLIDDATQRWLLRETGEFSDDPEEALQMALDRADLVMTEEPRAVYWMRSKLDVDWHRNGAMWEYFVTLCERTKQGRCVDAADFGDHCKPDNHIKKKSRLTTKVPGFPMDLGNRIVAEAGGRQRLDLPPERIRIIQVPD